MFDTAIRPVRLCMGLFLFSLAAVVAFASCGKKGYRQGEALYRQYCANCHMEDGTGLQGIIPPLAGSDYLRKNPTATACIIRYGLDAPVTVNGRTYDQPMAGIPKLNEFDIANIINYIHHSWGNDLGYFPLEKVRSALDTCAE